eukprot:355022-Chlamydomonas_euryale.AAC.4
MTAGAHHRCRRYGPFSSSRHAFALSAGAGPCEACAHVIMRMPTCVRTHACMHMLPDPHTPAVHRRHVAPASVSPAHLHVCTNSRRSDSASGAASKSRAWPWPAQTAGDAAVWQAAPIVATCPNARAIAVSTIVVSAPSLLASSTACSTKRRVNTSCARAGRRRSAWVALRFAGVLRAPRSAGARVCWL